MVKRIQLTRNVCLVGVKAKSDITLLCEKAVALHKTCPLYRRFGIVQDFREGLLVKPVIIAVFGFYRERKELI